MCNLQTKNNLTIIFIDWFYINNNFYNISLYQNLIKFPFVINLISKFIIINICYDNFVYQIMFKNDFNI